MLSAKLGEHKQTGRASSRGKGMAEQWGGVKEVASWFTNLVLFIEYQYRWYQSDLDFIIKSIWSRNRTIIRLDGCHFFSSVLRPICESWVRVLVVVIL
jgi:hypothetical protein